MPDRKRREKPEGSGQGIQPEDPGTPRGSSQETDDKNKKSWSGEQGKQGQRQGQGQREGQGQRPGQGQGQGQGKGQGQPQGQGQGTGQGQPQGQGQGKGQGQPQGQGQKRQGQSQGESEKPDRAFGEYRVKSDEEVIERVDEDLDRDRRAFPAGTDEDLEEDLRGSEDEEDVERVKNRKRDEF